MKYGAVAIAVATQRVTDAATQWQPVETRLMIVTVPVLLTVIVHQHTAHGLHPLNLPDLLNSQNHPHMPAMQLPIKLLLITASLVEM